MITAITTGVAASAVRAAGRIQAQSAVALGIGRAKMMDEMDHLIDEIFMGWDLRAPINNRQLPKYPTEACLGCDDPVHPGHIFCAAHLWISELSASEQDRIMAEPDAIAEDWLYYLKGGTL